MAELKITPEKILEAAAKCPTAKETLKTLFPEVFEAEGLMILRMEDKRIYNTLGYIAGFVKETGKYANKGIYLSNTFEWNIITENGQSILTAKEK